MKKLSLLSILAMTCAPRYMADEEPAATPVDPTTAQTPEQAAGVTPDVTVTVPAEHVSIVERVVTLLKEAESDITDNVKAGIEYLEQMWKDRNGG